MSKVIRCPHAVQHLEQGGSLQVLASEHGNYVELCDRCAHTLLDEVMASLPISQWKQAVKKVLEGKDS